MAHRPKQGRFNNVGIALAIVAGLIAIGFTQWPVAQPQGHGRAAWWAVSVWIVGFGNIAAAFLADRYPMVSKSLLTLGALWLAGSALVAAEVFRQPTLSWLAVMLDMLPAAIALVAAVLIGPVVMSPEEQATRMGVMAPEQHGGGERGADRAA